MTYTTALALAVRVSLALITRTLLEPAHFIVFGYGDLTWEWTSKPPIRSVLYPALNSPRVAAPKVMHGLLAAGTDIWVREVARKTLGQRYVPATFFLSLTSFFHAISLSRSMSNSLETTLTTAALKLLRKFLVFIALACSIRITSAITWAFLFPPLLCVTLCLLFTLDSVHNGTPTLTPLNFLRVNASSVSLFYGSAPWHYYLVQALPLLAGPTLPFVLHGAYLALTQGTRPLKLLLYTVIWTGTVFSFAGHKEWRFLHPLVPGNAHSRLRYSLVSLYDRTRPRSSTPTSSLRIKRTHASVLARTFASSGACPTRSCGSVGFLMPCHSTPAQSHLHRRIPVWRLSCEPPLKCVQLSSIFLSTSTPRSHHRHVRRTEYAWPSHLVLFGALLRERGVEDALRAKGYAEVWHAGNGIEEDPRRREGVRIWRWGATADKITI
ncbi:Alg9-like mannosyltransferase family-domain-containing protein [Lactarius psammicola]|nr:Alg9-like mannosyltransferase family-domain-containing protein [Lactarius psammicola]